MFHNRISCNATDSWLQPSLYLTPNVYTLYSTLPLCRWLASQCLGVRVFSLAKAVEASAHGSENDGIEQMNRWIHWTDVNHRTTWGVPCCFRLRHWTALKTLVYREGIILWVFWRTTGSFQEVKTELGVLYSMLTLKMFWIWPDYMVLVVILQMQGGTGPGFRYRG
jgi:hypothetical protein